MSPKEKTNKDKVLTFERDKDCSQIDIHLNDEGLTDLLEILKNLQSSNKSTHEHLMTPSWAGTELTENKMDKLSLLINKVTIHFWK